MNFPTRVQALTQDWIMPKVQDNVLGSSILPLRVISQGKKSGSGYTIKKAVKLSTAGYGSSFSGLDTFSAAQLDTKQIMEYDYRAYRYPVAVSGMEVSVNRIPATQVTNLIVETLEEVQWEMADDLGDIMYSDGTGNSNKDFMGLDAIVDDGTTAGTIGGLSRTTYSTLNAIRTASGGTLTLAKLATLFSAISSGTIMSTPNIIITNETVSDLYEQLLTPSVQETYSNLGYYQVGKVGGPTRQQEGLVGTQGFVAMTYKGIPWVRDEKATAQTVWMLNEKTLNWYGLESAPELGYKSIKYGSKTIDGVHAEAPMNKNTGFSWSGWKVPEGQYGLIGTLLIMGNLTCFEPRRNGRLTGVTGV